MRNITMLRVEHPSAAYRDCMMDTTVGKEYHGWLLQEGELDKDGDEVDALCFAYYDDVGDYCVALVSKGGFVGPDYE